MVTRPQEAVLARAVFQEERSLNEEMDWRNLEDSFSRKAFAGGHPIHPHPSGGCTRPQTPQKYGHQTLAYRYYTGAAQHHTVSCAMCRHGARGKPFVPAGRAVIRVKNNAGI
ncbi:unnamed protein product [Tuber aestivum]|uniref:Uncharacterized protein n=1 Tax=Tuber aestivum TaxID=59557 RepID=A0A292Q4J7_9PEZI|nr:unnamed protein product [Tuber aestivum]